MPTLLVFPHCDMHLALNPVRANKINFRVFVRSGNQGPFLLEDVTADCTFRLLAPYNEVGSRIDEFVEIDPDARTITAKKAGINLVVFQYTEPSDPDDSAYIVARIQVHDTMSAWWFGNRTITTALDPARSQTQPSIYASFSDDAEKTDLVGDITGHDFVSLDSSDPTIFTIDNVDHRGRLKGVAEGNATLNGAFLTLDQSIPVKVVDYSKPPNPLEQVRVHDLPNAADRHNILFLGDGFKLEDRPLFNEMVRKAEAELFSKPRHEPFATLSRSFNVFKAFTPSEDRLLTCGFKVTDRAVPGQRKGRPIPNAHRVSKDKNIYEVAQLIEIVGLPLRDEQRDLGQLVADWEGRSLHGFDKTKINGELVEAWRASHAVRFLEARDTYFGMILGGRWADGRSAAGPPIDEVLTDDGSDALIALVRRAYEFFRERDPARFLGMDPRRHAPEHFARGRESRTTFLLTFIEALQLHSAQSGEIWVPDDDFKPSRGLVVMIINEPMDGGTSLNRNTFVAVNMNGRLSLAADDVANLNPKIMALRRTEPAGIEVDYEELINTIAHELGHSFRLGDEYENRAETTDFRQRHLNAAANQSDNFDRHDNITSLETIFADPNFLDNTDRTIDVAKVKWRTLQRARLSARLTANTAFAGGKIEAMIDPREAQPWIKEKGSGTEVHLRAVRFESTGRQLPLSTSNEHHLNGLIVNEVDPGTGRIVLSSVVPLSPDPDFAAGSYLFIPHRVEGGAMRTVIDPLVHAELATSKSPLNSDTDASRPKDGPDEPRAINGFEPPCVSARVIGVYEGAADWSGLVYRPAGTCKMRTNGGKERHGEFCHVCKWLITNRVDPGLHALVDRKFYPSADTKKKKRKKGKR